MEFALIGIVAVHIWLRVRPMARYAYITADLTLKRWKPSSCEILAVSSFSVAMIVARTGQSIGKCGSVRYQTRIFSQMGKDCSLKLGFVLVSTLSSVIYGSNQMTRSDLVKEPEESKFPYHLIGILYPCCLPISVASKSNELDRHGRMAIDPKQISQWLRCLPANVVQPTP